MSALSETSHEESKKKLLNIVHRPFKKVIADNIAFNIR